MVKKNGMGFARIRSPQDYEVGLFDFAVRTGSATCSEDRRQTGDAGGVSSPIAAVNIVRPHHAANEFLGCIIQFIRGLGAAEHADIPRITLVDGLAKRRSNAVHRFIP